MSQQGFIIEIIDNKTAKLKMQRHSACASCGKCITSSESKDIVVEVDNTIGARVGDHVEVDMDKMNILKATLIVYAIPLVSLLVGTGGMFYLLEKIGVQGNIEVMSGVFGLLLTFITYLLIKKKDNKFRDSREYIPIVTRILIKL